MHAEVLGIDIIYGDRLKMLAHFSHPQTMSLLQYNAQLLINDIVLVEPGREMGRNVRSVKANRGSVGSPQTNYLVYLLH